MVTGYVRSKGLNLSGRQVSKSVQRVNPVDHNRRREDTVQRRNPVPYNAPYHGNKLHCDKKTRNWGCMGAPSMHLAMAAAQESLSCSPCP